MYTSATEVSLSIFLSTLIGGKKRYTGSSTSTTEGIQYKRLAMETILVKETFKIHSRSI